MPKKEVHRRLKRDHARQTAKTSGRMALSKAPYEISKRRKRAGVDRGEGFSRGVGNSRTNAEGGAEKGTPKERWPRRGMHERDVRKFAHRDATESGWKKRRRRDGHPEAIKRRHEARAAA